MSKATSETFVIPGVAEVTINGEPSVENCKTFIKILMDAKNKR